MLMALLIALFFGGGSTAMLAYVADTQNTVKIVMVNDDRRKSALSTLREMKKRTNARNRRVKRAMKDLNITLQQYDVGTGDIDEIWAGYFAEVDQYKDDMLDLRWELKQHISRDEWETIFPGEKNGDN